jgi:hypothetical protein
MNLTCPLPIDWLDFIETGEPTALAEHLASCRSCEELVSALRSAEGEKVGSWQADMDFSRAVRWRPESAATWSFGDLALSAPSFVDDAISYADLNRLLFVVLDDGVEQDGRVWHRAAPVETDVEIAGETDLILAADETMLGVPLRMILGFQSTLDAGQLNERVSTLTAAGRDLLQATIQGETGDERFGVALRGPDDTRVDADRAIEELLRTLRAPFFARVDTDVEETDLVTTEGRELVESHAAGDVFFDTTHFDLTLQAIETEELALAAATAAAATKVMVAELKAEFGALTGLLLYTMPDDTLRFIVKDIVEFHANQMKLFVRAHDRIFESPAFRPQEGKEITIASGMALFVEDVEDLVAKAE